MTKKEQQKEEQRILDIFRLRALQDFSEEKDWLTEQEKLEMAYLKKKLKNERL